MVNYNSVVANIEAPNYREKNLKKYQNTGDIIKDLIYCFKNYNYQCKPIAKNFSTGNIKRDSKKIYDFIRENIRYEAEADKLQTTKSFSRILHDKEGDCKHSALIVGCIGWQLGYNVIFKFVSYTPGESYGHVYTILQDPQTKEKIIVDPLQPFNTEKYYYKNIKYLAVNNQIKKEMLSRLTGTAPYPNVPQNSRITMNGVDIEETKVIDGIGKREILLTPNLSDENLAILEQLHGIGRSKAQRQQAKAARQEKRSDKKEARQEKRTERKTNRQEKRADRKETRVEKRAARGGSIVKKVAVAPIRAAFDALLLVNFRDFANRLSIAIEKNPVAVQKFAAKFGYNYNFLVSQINKGKNKKPLFGSVNGLGSVTISAAAIATAAPAVIAVVALFKALGIGSKAGAPSDDKLLNDAANALQTSGDGTSPALEAIEKGIDLAKSVLNNPSSTPEQREQAQEQLDKLEDAKDKANGSFIETLKNLPLPVKLAGAAGLGFLIYKLATKRK